MMAVIHKKGVFAVLKDAKIMGELPETVTGVTCDSRQVRPGSIFVALRGSKKDGADFVSDAIARGASVIVSERNVPSPICSVCVADANEALAMMAGQFYDMPAEKMFVVGITGTNGKTTTAYILSELLGRARREAGLIGTVEYRIAGRVIPATRTTPEAPALQKFLADMVSAGCDAAVMEVSSHALVQKRVKGIDFDVAILTNLARDHLDYHKSSEAYADAKRQLFLDLRHHGFAVLNLDDPLGADLAVDERLVCHRVTYGTAGDADYRVSMIAPEFDGTSFQLDTNGRTYNLRTNLIGRFNVANLVAALAAAELAGVPIETSARALSNLPTVPGRLEAVPNDRGIKILVDYAHTDDALEKVLTTLRETTDGRLILVFGCGGDRDVSKRSAMGSVADRLADYTIVTSDNPRTEDPEEIVRQIETGFSGTDSHEACTDRAQAIRNALAMCERGDVLLIAGKGHENFQEFRNTTVSFDDRMVVKRILEGG